MVVFFLSKKLKYGLRSVENIQDLKYLVKTRAFAPPAAGIF